MCLSQGRTGISKATYRCLFCVQWLEVICCCSFWKYWRNCWLALFKMFLIITTKFSMYTYTYVTGWWLERSMGGVFHWKKAHIMGGVMKLSLQQTPTTRSCCNAQVLGDRTPSPLFSNYEYFYHIFQLLFSVNLDTYLIHVVYIYNVKKKCPFLYQTCRRLIELPQHMHLKFCIHPQRCYEVSGLSESVERPNCNKFL